MTCTRCGAPLGAGAMFCGECGARVVGDVTAVAPAVDASALVTVAMRLPPQGEPTDAVPPVMPLVMEEESQAVDPRPIVDHAEDEGFDETILSSRRGPTWSIVTPDGTWHPIHTPTVVGRSPVVPDGRDGLSMLALADEGKSLSKTHAILLPDGDSLSIEDLGSTNGVIITTRDGVVTEAVASVATRLELGSVVELGDYILVIERS